jgi:hypothetical protein
MKALTACLCALAAAPAAFAATAAEWRNRTIYQLLTDRFANPSSNSQCENLSDYCGGTFQGIIRELLAARSSRAFFLSRRINSVSGPARRQTRPLLLGARRCAFTDDQTCNIWHRP